MTTPAPQDDVPATQVEVGPPKTTAAGVPAVLVALNRSREQMGVVRTARTLTRLNQAHGFDCMGCAWPDPRPGDRSRAEFCENGAKAVAEEATVRRVGPDFFAAHSLQDLATRSDYWLGQQGRLTHPMVRRDGADHYTPISWDEAFALVASRLRALGSPDEAVFYTSGRASNEAAFVYQLFVRAFGTNNLPDCSNMCHESTSVALAETIGIGKGSVSLDDVHQADLVVICGQNPGTNHPRMLTALEKAKQRGARILAVNPLPEAGLLGFRNPQTPRGVSGVGTTLADLHLPIRTNGDLALFQAVGALLLDADAAGGVLDHDFVERHTEGFEAWRKHLAELDWDRVLEATGLDRAQIEQTAAMFAGSRRTVICWAMGITQHRNAVATIKEIVNVALAQGNIGKPGAGLCPVRGHSNVQGDRTMGIWEKLPTHFGDALRDEFGFEPPRRRGLDVVDSVRALRDGSAKVFVALGGNFAAAAPDTPVTYAALESADLTVHVSTKLNRSHVTAGRTSLILPTLGRTEVDLQESGPQSVSVEDSMSAVHLSHGPLDPAGPLLRSEVAIITGLAEATLGSAPEGSRIDWAAMRADYRRIREHIAHVVPGCEAYPEKVEQPGGFVLPHPPRDSRTFETPDGRAQFTVSPLDVLRVPDGHVLLQSLRSHDQFNTTVYGHDDRYRGISGGRDVVMVHPDDITAFGLEAGGLVDLVGTWEDGSVRVVRGFRVVPYDTPRGCVAAYYPEVNPLVPLDSTAVGSNCPTSKSVVIRLAPTASADHAAVRAFGPSPRPVGSDDHHKSGVQPHHLS
ncbi:FdhF/YdeP family oxidoreductase [Kineosporia sp. R_H_3]|uniref:FdhF/YdeP family oxidoreductase n=1 Tax=Kineosporia sp. R_H_3 TaxID=1961848 RepID=UPI000B4A6B50|nr:FdhF/YdeP family oxidoreductase [Kineosporia sp. R_H_3]